MKIDKAKICCILRSKYPKAFGIRRKLQGIKVKRLKRHLLSKEEVEACEAEPVKIKETIKPYLKRWKKYLRPTFQEIDDILENAPLYQKRQDKEQLRTEMLFFRLAYGFLPSEYVGFELEGKTPKEYKGFVSDIDTLVFGYSVNDIARLQKVLDKGYSYLQFGEYFGRDAIIVDSRRDYKKFQEFIKKHPVFVKKKVFSCMGKGVEIVDIRTVKEMEYAYFKKLVASGKFLLEEKVIQHDEMSKFNPSSVNTIRCITLKTNCGVEMPYCFMRVGRKGSFVDNGGAGGLLVGIDTTIGVLNTDGFSEYNERFIFHPDTEIRFRGSKIPAWSEAIAFAKEAAFKVKDINYLSWDLAYTKKGWVVIEVNEVGQLIGPQIVMKQGIKKELSDYFDRMDKAI